MDCGTAPILEEALFSFSDNLISPIRARRELIIHFRALQSSPSMKVFIAKGTGF